MRSDTGALIEAARDSIPHVMREESIPGLNVANVVNHEVL
jgi:hypothetical protein